MTKKQEVATVESTAVALPDDMLALLASDAKESASLERPAISGISLRGGMLSYNGEPVKGNKLRVVFLAASHLNTFYATKWDPDNLTNPNCFAISESGEAMAPHQDVTDPEGSVCETCPKFQWKSDIRDGKAGKGKACKETRRLVMLPESALESAEDIAAAELAMVKLPVTSVKAWGGFVNTLAATLNLPFYAVISEITTQPDMKTQFKVVITPVARIESVETLRAIIAKREEAKRIAMVPFDPLVPPEDDGIAPAEADSKQKF